MDTLSPAVQPRHVVALDTYGTEQVLSPADHKRVAAIKCVRAVPAILKLLFGDQAEDVTPPRASYSYIRLSAAYHLKKSYLVLRLTDEELAQVEALTRPQAYGPWVFLWRDGNWHEFPCQSHAEYRLASATSATSYPRFSGASVPWLIPSRRSTAARAEQASPGNLTIQLIGDWWWISGDTRPHREALDTAGCRWSKRRQQWYYIGSNLPEAVRSLATAQVGATEASSSQTNVEAEAASAERSLTLHARRLVTVGREFVGSRDYTWILEGRPTLSEQEILTRRCDPLGSGQWRFVGEHLPEDLAALVIFDEEQVQSAHAYPSAVLPRSSATIPTPEATAPAQPTDTSFPVPPSILPPPVSAQDLITLPAESATLLPQTYLGRVNVVGDCFCYGLVLDHRPPSYKGVPIYLSVAGPATSVEAVWARLSQGKETTVVPDDKNAPAIYLEPNKGGLYTRYQKKIEALGIDHLILLHENLADPAYSAEDDAVPVTYVLCLSADHRCAKLGEHVRKLVKVAVFEAWFDYLYAEGRSQGLLRSCTGYAVEALGITLDRAKWTALITAGLATRKIALP